jgi:hypothetical protein
MVEKELQTYLQREEEMFQLNRDPGYMILWKHRNSCVFQGTQPSMSNIMQEHCDEHHLWGLAGAQELLSLEHNTNRV